VPQILPHSLHCDFPAERIDPFMNMCQTSPPAAPPFASRSTSAG
jgi:hypothetical protein